MKITNLGLKKLEIPFRVSFKHSSAERTSTEAVIAIASCNEQKGYGEGCPRHYVTGESIESCMDFLQTHKKYILQIDSINSLKAFVADNSLEIDKNPAAWCAIETAILELLSKLEEKSIEAIISIPEVNGTFQYTAVLGVANSKVFSAQLAQYIQLGFRDFKVKISGDVLIDKSNIASIIRLQPDAKIRLDANNLWTNADDAASYLATLNNNFWAIEEPIKAGDYAGMEKLAQQIGCKIILDESFLAIGQLPSIQNHPDIFIANIRISKMGGLLRSLSIAEECKKYGIKFIIGAQVGETSILTRMAISLANAYRECLIAQEGAFGTHLLEHDIIEKPIVFGKGGVLSIQDIRIGLSIKFDYSS